MKGTERQTCEQGKRGSRGRSCSPLTLAYLTLDISHGCSKLWRPQTKEQSFLGLPAPGAGDEPKHITCSFVQCTWAHCSTGADGMVWGWCHTTHSPDLPLELEKLGIIGSRAGTYSFIHKIIIPSKSSRVSPFI